MVQIQTLGIMVQAIGSGFEVDANDSSGPNLVATTHVQIEMKMNYHYIFWHILVLSVIIIATVYQSVYSPNTFRVSSKFTISESKHG